MRMDGTTRGQRGPGQEEKKKRKKVPEGLAKPSGLGVTSQDGKTWSPRGVWIIGCGCGCGCLRAKCRESPAARGCVGPAPPNLQVTHQLMPPLEPLRGHLRCVRIICSMPCLLGSSPVIVSLLVLSYMCTTDTYDDYLSTSSMLVGIVVSTRIFKYYHHLGLSYYGCFSLTDRPCC